MKKILLITFALACAGATALAQGTINFQSANANAYVAYFTSLTPVGPGFTAALYGGPAGALEGQLSQLGSTTSVTAGSGLIIGGGTRTNPFVAGGATGAFQVRAWNNGYATYEAAISGGAPGTMPGKTAVFSNSTGNPAASPPGTPAFLTGWNTPLLVGIPEPSGLALFGLTSVIFLVFQARRKKQT